MMKEFTVTIQLDNAVFEEQPAYEIRRILTTVVHELIEHPFSDDFMRVLRDSNGNTVGSTQVIEV